MKYSAVVAALLLMLSLKWADGVSAETPSWVPAPSADPLHGKAPDDSVEKWIRLVLLTPRSSAPPIFFISPAEFNVSPPQILIQLSSNQYKFFAHYTRRNRCEVTSRDYLPSDVLEVVEHLDGGTYLLCKMPIALACRYLGGIESVPRIGREEKRWGPLRRLRVSLGCR